MLNVQHSQIWKNMYQYFPIFEINKIYFASLSEIHKVLIMTKN